MNSFSVNQGEGHFVDMIPGVKRRNLVVGKTTMLCEFHLKEGVVLPLHQHPHEQTGYLISGRALFEIDGKEIEMKPGDSWSIGGDVPHQVTVLETAQVIETFTPVREDFL
ncbi:cupin domain-containing protein [Anoxynatronum sibiricum]|uniref:Cupin domain-containing protein n=1 Tax=Anoxynatronum sibiricum TaxID=210623 RepID=A0ABU9VUW3_9CLOT